MERPPLLELMKHRPVVLDGAMGTLLYDEGVAINQCFDQENITSPERVEKIYTAYSNTGVDIVKTNSFGANRVRLAEYGLADQVEAINRAAVDLGKKAITSQQYLAASVGPCLKPSSVWTTDIEETIESAFREQLAVLVEAGVDIILFETFSHISELKLAVNTAREIIKASNRPDTLICGGFTLGENGVTAVGDSGEKFIEFLNDRADLILFNCGQGPSGLYDSIDQFFNQCKRPVLVSPNAGLPREIDNRTVYLSTPEYFARYARRLVKLGVSGVGGCCGTNLEHIKAVVKELKNLENYEYLEVKQYEQVAESSEEQATPVAEKSAVAKLFYPTGSDKSNKPVMVTSIELLPPRGTDLEKVLRKSEVCKNAGINAINLPDGPRASARLSPAVTAKQIESQVGIETILHYTCRDRNLLAMQGDLLGAEVMGLKNILAVTGDPPKLGDFPDSKGVFDIDAIGLIQTMTNLNHGMGLGGDGITPTSSFIGAALNPTVSNKAHEIDRMKKKVAAGAEFFITQPIFDANQFVEFMELIDKEFTLEVPIMAGVWPLYSYKNAEFLKNEVPGVLIPDKTLHEMSFAKTKEEGIAMGIKLAQEICKEIAPWVKGYQVSAPFGREDIAINTLDF